MQTIKMRLALAAFALLPALSQAAPEEYTIEPGHTYPSFETSHMGLSLWRGKFDKSRGKIWLDRAAKTGKLDITIDIASVNFGLPMMDTRAKSDHFFDVEKYPTATYRSDSITFEGDVPVAVNGQLTLRGITKSVPLKIVHFKCTIHPMFKREICGADARAEFDRRDFGMNRDIVLTDPNVRLSIAVEALRGAELPAMPTPKMLLEMQSAGDAAPKH
ncbi:MAG: YceI family protein [Sphingomonadaceae bacterium]